MDVLSRRPNILFLIWIRNQNIHFLLNKKLRRPIYRIKLINALTTIENGVRDGKHFKVWKVNGKLHRGLSQDGKVEPAYIIGISNDNPNGTLNAYYRNGERHRDDGPAIINGISKYNPNGTSHYYYNNGNRHREDGPAYIDGISNDNPNGTSHYYHKNGKLHRGVSQDGKVVPAIIRGISIDNPNGTQHAYLRNGELHRDDGPAIIRGISKDNPNGTHHSYYINGENVEPF